MLREFDLKQLAASREFQKVIKHVQAALLSIEDLALLESVKSQKAKAWDRMKKVLARVHKKNARFSPREIDDDVDAAIAAIRHLK